MNNKDKSVEAFAPSARGQYSGIAVYVINLDRSKARYAYVKNRILALGLPTKRISGVDGRTLSDEVVKSKVDLNAYKRFLGHLPRKGSIGCSLSHIKLWREFLNSDYKFAVIFEDDVSFVPAKLKLAIEDLTEKFSELWDINSFEMSHNGMPLTVATFQNNQKLSVYLMEIRHSGAYIINRKAAYELLSKALPIQMPIDHYISRSWEFALKFTGVENPRLVKQSLATSDIAKTNRVNKDSISIFDMIKRGLYKLQSYGIRFAYNLLVYTQICQGMFDKNNIGFGKTPPQKRPCEQIP